MKEKGKEEKDSLEFKIITLGNMGVGKTSIIQRFVNDTFNENQISTLGVRFSFKTIEIKKTNIKLIFIDTGGQEKFRSISASYFRHADVVLFVFNLNDSKSFESVQYWIDTFNENNNGKNIKFKYLIGNKNDLGQIVDQNLIDELNKKNDLLYVSTSAKTSNQIDELFYIIAEDLYEYTKKNKLNKKNNGKKEIVLYQTNMEKKKGGCCN